LSPSDDAWQGAARGLFVAVDGPDGVGKTTTIDALVRQFASRGLAVHRTTEPSPTPLGDFIRRAQESYRGVALACLVAADRYHHVATEIAPRQDAGQIVVCDRYIASSLVLQRMDGVDLDFIWQLNRHAPSPDLTVVCSPSRWCLAGGSPTAAPMADLSARPTALRYSPGCTGTRATGWRRQEAAC
jgi:hypothetical protein